MDANATADEQRFTCLFVEHRAQVLAYVRRRVPDEQRAQDVVAETFLAAWRHLERVPDSPLPWLYRAASFEVGRLRRTIGRHDRLDAPRPVPAGDPAEEFLDAERFSRAFSCLSRADREVLRLLAWEQLSMAEAAFVLGCSIATFRVRLHRARRRLARALEEVPSDDPRGPSLAIGKPDGARIRATHAAKAAPAKPAVLGKEHR